nr:hypothetical protein [Tanacetum cinerariifolium]
MSGLEDVKYIIEPIMDVVILTQKVFANMRRVGKWCSGVETSLFEGMIVEQQVAEGDDDEVHVEDVNAAGVTTEGVVSAADDIVPTADDEPSIPPPTPPPQPSQDQPSTSQREIIANIDADEDVVLEDAKDVAADAKDGQDADIDESANIQGRTAKSQAKIYQINLEHANKVYCASTTITVAAIPIPAATIDAAPTLTAAPSRRRNGVVIWDPQETANPSTIIHSEAKSKDKGKGILVEEPKPLKKQVQIEQDEKYARELEAEQNKNIDWDEVIDHVKRKQKEDNAVKRYQALKRKPQTEAQARKNMMIYLRNQKTKEQMDEEDSRALKRLNESQEEKEAKKQKLDEEVEELKRHLQIVPNDEDDVYTEATPLARKVPVVGYEIYNENNKPYYKIKRADSTHQLYLSFLSLLRNFDRKDLESLWSLVKKRFATAKPKNFSDDFLLITLGAMFE